MDQDLLPHKFRKNKIVKLIIGKYYENIIDLNEKNSTAMWKTLK